MGIFKISKCSRLISNKENVFISALLCAFIIVLTYSCNKESRTSKDSEKSITIIDKRLKAMEGSGYYCTMCDAAFIRGRCVGDQNYRECHPGSGKDCPPKISSDIVVYSISQAEISDPGFQPAVLLDELYNFRDNYLMNSSKGIAYMNTYYYLSDELFDNNTTYSLSNALYMLNTINSYVLPNTFELLTNPNSSTILIDEVEKSNLLAFMDWAKDLMPNQISKDIVDQLKLDLIINSNVPVYQVHSFLTN